MGSCYQYCNGSLSKLLLTVLSLFIFKTCSADFTEVPITLNITAGTEAVFRCQHSVADSLGWRVNHTSVERNPLPEISEGAGTLTILALPEYNGTVVECVALFFDGSLPALTPSAFLIVQGSCDSTVAIAFIQESESQNAGETVKFNCSLHPTFDVGWSLNETSESVNISNVSAISISLFDGYPPRDVLIFGVIPIRSGAVVQCRFARQSRQCSAPMLLIQGPLLSVSALVRGFISDQTFSWNPPPTLDLTNVEPDIAYCVTIHNITCGGNDFLIGDCSQTDPFYIYEDIHPGHVYSIEVIPRSNVERALNGTPLFVKESFITYQAMHIILIKEDDSLNISVILEISPNTSNSISGYKIVPDKYDVIVTAADGVDNLPTTISQTLQGDIHNLTFRLEGKRIWRYEFFAYSCKQHSLGNISISTHDAYNISVTSPRPGVVMVTGNIINGTSAKGVLIIVYSPMNDSDILYITSEVRQQGGINADLRINNGNYGVAVFTLEGTGLPFSRVAALPQVVEHKAKGGAVESNPTPTKVKYELLHSNSTGVCITCTFLNSSATDCVAVVHQRISQLSSSGLMNIKSSHKFNRSGDTAYGCIEGVIYRDMEYQIGVIGALNFQERDTEHRNGISRSISTAVILSILMMVVITALTVIVMLKCIITGSKSLTASQRPKRVGDALHQPVNAIYLYEDPNQNVITQNLRLLLPHKVKWRIVANVFNISPDSLGIQETDEDYLREILVQCVDRHDFQFKLDIILDRLNKEAEEEVEMTTMQGASDALEKEHKKPDNSIMENTLTVGSAGCTEQIVSMLKDNFDTGAEDTTGAAALTRPIQESGNSKAKGYEGVVKEQLRYVNVTDRENESDEIADFPTENADMNKEWSSNKPWSKSGHRFSRVQQVYRSAPDEDKEPSLQFGVISVFAHDYPPFVNVNEDDDTL